MEWLAVFSNTANVQHIDVQEEVVRVVTTGGTELYSLEGELVEQHWEDPPHRVEAPFEGGILRGEVDGTLTFEAGGQEVSWQLGCPITDIDSSGRIACLFTAYQFTWRPEEVVVPASAAADTAWGLTNGAILTDEGIVGRVPGRVTALAQVGEHWWVGTADGLYRVGDSVERLTSDNQICGNFVTGTAVFEETLVVATFDRGACSWDGQRWATIPLPTQLVNDVVVYEDALWFATSDGLIRSDGERFYVKDDGVFTDVAVGDRFWATSLVGPVSHDGERWRRHRYNVFGTSYQTVSSCGEMALAGSEDAGLTIYNGRRWQQHDALGTLPDEWVMAVECVDEVAYAGLYDDGLWVLDRTWQQIPLEDDWVLSLAHDGEQMWVGTMGGLFALDHDGVLWTPDPRVHHVASEGGVIYAGTEGGLVLYAAARP